MYVNLSVKLYFTSVKLYFTMVKIDKNILKNQLVIHNLMVSWRVYKTTQTTGDHSPVSDKD